MNRVRPTYGVLALDRGAAGGGQDAWRIDALDPHVRIRLKHIFPRIKKTDPPPYVFPNDLQNAADLEWFVSRYPLAMSETDARALKAGRLAFEGHQAEMERILAPDYAPPRFPGLKPGMAVRAYQAQAVEILMRSTGLLLGDEVGLGKTFVGAAACLIPGALPAAVVCHPHLQGQWVKVIEAFTTLSAHAVTKTKPYALPPCDVRVFRYTQLAGWSDMIDALGCGLAVFDEIQELRTGLDSYKGIAAMTLAHSARLRLGLTATPIYNYGVEIFRIMRYLRGDALGDFNEFCREWAPSGRISDPKALGAMLREQHAFLRRTKADVGQEMAPVNRIVDVIDYDVAAMRSVDDLAEELAVRATSGAFTERGEATRMLDLRVRQITGVAKAANVAAVARIIVQGGSPIVLVGWHREVYEIWNAALEDLAPAMYTGSESAAQKAREVERFLSGETDILIMSLRSGAGLDGLQARCSTMVFGELDWSPGVHHQCIGRLDREGQGEPVTAIFLVVDDGSDPPMMDVLGLKASEASQIVDPGLGVTTAHSDASHLRTLVQRYLGKRGIAAPREVRGPGGEVVSAGKMACLAELAKCPKGSGSIGGVMSGGDLAALVQFGLAVRLPEDRLGGQRYGVSEDGWTLLELEGLASRPGEAA